MFFSFDNSGNLVTSSVAVDGVLCFGLDSLPSDWYSQLATDYSNKLRTLGSELAVDDEAVKSLEPSPEDLTATDATVRPRKSKVA